MLFQGEVVVSAERFKDGWMRGIRIRDLAVGFFPSSIVRRTGEGTNAHVHSSCILNVVCKFQFCRVGKNQSC